MLRASKLFPEKYVRKCLECSENEMTVTFIASKFKKKKDLSTLVWVQNFIIFKPMNVTLWNFPYEPEDNPRAYACIIYQADSYNLFFR